MSERRQLGWGLRGDAVDADSHARDIQLVGGPGGLDVATVEGNTNFLQDIEVALTTALGSDRFNRDFGFDGLRIIAEAEDRDTMVNLLRLAVARTLSSDPRVVAIHGVRVVTDDASSRTLGLQAEFRLRSSEADSLTFNVTLPLSVP